MIRTNNGGVAQAGTELCIHSTTREERDLILAREERVAAWRKTLPKRRKPVHEKAGPITWIQLC